MERYVDLRHFCRVIPKLLAGPQSRFSFFNGLGATSKAPLFFWRWHVLHNQLLIILCFISTPSIILQRLINYIFVHRRCVLRRLHKAGRAQPCGHWARCAVGGRGCCSRARRGEMGKNEEVFRRQNISDADWVIEGGIDHGEV